MSDFKTKILFFGSPKAYVHFRVKTPCFGETLIADLYDIGVGVCAEGIQIGTTPGGNVDDEITIPIDTSNMAIGKYSLIIRTIETGLISRGVILMIAQDGQSLTALTIQE